MGFRAFLEPLGLRVEGWVEDFAWWVMGTFQVYFETPASHAITPVVLLVKPLSKPHGPPQTLNQWGLGLQVLGLIVSRFRLWGLRGLGLRM